jgi:transcriptional regulator with XRE-family HTH domain
MIAPGSPLAQASSLSGRAQTRSTIARTGRAQGGHGGSAPDCQARTGPPAPHDETHTRPGGPLGSHPKCQWLPISCDLDDWVVGTALVTYETTGSVKGGVARRAGEQRRAELGEFLKACRARLSPGDFGLPPGSRRRTPGLRREEVALLAGVGVTWYTWLEQGRQINASTQVLDAVARTLRLDRAEREHLYRLAEATPLRTECVRTEVPGTIREIVRSLEPLPAILLNSRFDILLSNDAHEELFWEWHSMPCIHKNTLWCCITESSARGRFPDYDKQVRYMVARLRSAYSRNLGDQGWEEDIRRLACLSREFAELWARHEVADSEPRVLTYLHPQAGPLSLALSELNVPDMPEAHIQVYTPYDDDTRARMPLTRRPAVATPDLG